MSNNLERTKAEYQRFIEGAMNVYQIFVDHFGEDRVDIQRVISEENYIKRGVSLSDSPFILVHFPEVRITNEHDKYVDVKDLWTKTTINYKGIGGSFGISRSHYPASHYTSDYLHSHVSGVNNGSHIFLSPCLGTGPIRDTIASLNIAYDENLWRLYCLELEIYMKTESLSGVPYRRLENIHKNKLLELGTNLPVTTNFNTFEIPKGFIEYIINSNKLEFVYYNGGYNLGMSELNFNITISNLYIKWYNDTISREELPDLNLLFLDEFLVRRVVKDGKLFMLGSERRNVDAFNGTKLFTFKGEDVIVSIVDDTFESLQEEPSLLLHPKVAGKIAAALIFVLNYRYGKQNNTPNNQTTRYYL